MDTPNVILVPGRLVEREDECLYARFVRLIETDDDLFVFFIFNHAPYVASCKDFPVYMVVWIAAIVNRKVGVPFPFHKAVSNDNSDS